MTKNSTPTNKKTTSITSDDGQEFTQFQEKLLQLKNFYATGSTPAKEDTRKKTGAPSVVAPAKTNSPSSPAPKIEKTDLGKDQDVKKIQTEARRKRFEQLKLALDWLVENYPLCFNKENPRPLKKRIEKDIFMNLPEGLSFSKVSVREALHYYTSSSQYRQNLINASHRYNLQGEAGEEVTENEKQLAQELLALFIAKQKERNQHRKKFAKKPAPKSIQPQ